MTSVLGLAVLGVVLFRALRDHRELVERTGLLRQRVMQAEQQLGALCSASLGAGDHLVKLEHRVQRVMERQDALEMRPGNERPYAQASQLVNKGADIDELVEACGLTRGEAELLVMMQRGAA
ncbi:MAG: DUF2802 domain-containing protein [Thiogranum sp.]|nr:DUF2802 domain-containing protein [Thiogranum sp.]